MKRLVPAACGLLMAVAVVVGPPAQATEQACSYDAGSVSHEASDTVIGDGSASGTCGTVYMNLKRQRPGPDQVLDNESREGAGALDISKSCDWSGSWGIYVEVYGDQDSTSYSSVVEINCISPRVPVPG